MGSFRSRGAPPIRPVSDPPALPPDAEVVRRVRAGDAAAFEALFRTYFPGLRDFAAALTRSPEMAEEVVQDVFAALWLRRARWEVHGGSVRGYLYGAVRNGAASRGRHSLVEKRWFARFAGDPAEEGSASAPDPLAEVAAGEISERVRRAVDALPERARVAVTLRWMHGLRNAEIAEAMGISVKGVEVQITRALKALRESLADHLR